MRRRRRKQRADELTDRQTLELMLGPMGAFQNDAEREAAWWANRDTIMGSVNRGTRPWAFWEFEIGEHPAEGERQFDALRRLDLLTEDEKKGRYGNR